MKKFLTLLMVAVSFTTTNIALADEAGSCHFHGKKIAKEETVSNCAADRKELLIMDGKIDPSWTAVEQEKIELVDGKKGKEWLVTFVNPAATDKAKAKLYLFFTAPGNFVAANFTGK
jgi:hypothetical protein